jgi:hypothetical protein
MWVIGVKSQSDRGAGVARRRSSPGRADGLPPPRLGGELGVVTWPSTAAAIPLGWAQAVQREPEAGLATIELERGFAAIHRWTAHPDPFHRGLQAEVHLAVDDLTTALALLDEASPSV